MTKTTYGWEDKLSRLTRVMLEQPSPQTYMELAECYIQLGEDQEARVILDMERMQFSEASGHAAAALSER